MFLTETLNLFRVSYRAAAHFWPIWFVFPKCRFNLVTYALQPRKSDSLSVIKCTSIWLNEGPTSSAGRLGWWTLDSYQYQMLPAASQFSCNKERAWLANKYIFVSKPVAHGNLRRSSSRGKLGSNPGRRFGLWRWLPFLLASTYYSPAIKCFKER